MHRMPTNNLLNSLLFILAFIPISLSGGNIPSKVAIVQQPPLKIIINQHALDSLQAVNRQKELKLEELLQNYELTYRADSTED